MAYQIDIPEEILKIAREAAAAAGVPVDRFLMRAILDALEDYEDNRDANEAMRRIAAGEDKTYSLSELEQILGLDDNDDGTGEETIYKAS